jgi:hypothetical protein
VRAAARAARAREQRGCKRNCLCRRSIGGYLSLLLVLWRWLVLQGSEVSLAVAEGPHLLLLLLLLRLVVVVVGSKHMRLLDL